MRQPEIAELASKRPVVMVVVDGSVGYGRSIFRGLMRYANMERKWLIRSEIRRVFDENRKWSRVDGAVVAGIGRTGFEKICKSARYAIHCSGGGDPLLSPVVCFDDVAAGRVAAEHLMDCRLEHFGFYGDSSWLTSVNRAHGFITTLALREFKVSISPVKWIGNVEQNTLHWRKLIAWLRSLPKPTGILAVDDSAASDVAAACLKAGINVPEEIAIIGVNNDDLLCESAWPPLSSVEADFSRMGYASGHILDRLFRGDKLSPEERFVRFPPLGVVRRLSTDVVAVSDSNVSQAVRYIREHACDPCTVDDVLRHVPVGRRWLERQFTKDFKRAPHDEILRVQMEAAKRHLVQPILSIPEIALRCGFSSATSLSRSFLRSNGLTPAAYRKQALRATP